MASYINDRKYSREAIKEIEEIRKHHPDYKSNKWVSCYRMATHLTDIQIKNCTVGSGYNSLTRESASRELIQWWIEDDECCLDWYELEKQLDGYWPDNFEYQLKKPNDNAKLDRNIAVSVGVLMLAILMIALSVLSPAFVPVAIVIIIKYFFMWYYVKHD